MPYRVQLSGGPYDGMILAFNYLPDDALALRDERDVAPGSNPSPRLPQPSARYDFWYFGQQETLVYRFREE